MMIVPRSSRFGLDALDELLQWPLFDRKESRVMHTDIKESDNQYVLSVELPGFAKEDIKLAYDNGYLTISASRNETKEEKDGQGRIVHQERSSGACSRSFYLGESIDRSLCKASHQDGVLTIVVPKGEALATNRYIEIE